MTLRPVGPVSPALLGALGTLVIGAASSCGSPRAAVTPRSLAASGAQEQLGLCERASEMRELTLDLRAGERVLLRELDGALRVRAARTDAPHLNAHLGAIAPSTELAWSMLEEIRIRTERDAAGLVILVARPETSDSFLTNSRYDLVVPAGVRLKVESSIGGVSASGPLAGCRIETRGDVRLSDLSGGVIEIHGTGGVVLERVEATRLSSEVRHGSLEMEHVRASSILAISRSGDISLRDVSAESTRVDSSVGTIRLSDVHGAIETRSISGEIHIDSCSGPRLVLVSDDGDIRIRDVKAELGVLTRIGSITVEGLTGAIDARTGHGAIDVRGLLEGLQAANTSGTIRVTALPGSAPTSTWSLRSKHGDLLLSIAPDFACNLDALAEHASIHSDVVLAIEATSAPRGDRLRGSLGEGGELVKLRSTHGNVSVLRLEP